MKDVAPYFVPSADAVVAGDWERTVDGEREPLKAYVENWDQRTTLHLTSSLTVDCDRVRHETRLLNGVDLIWSAGWRTVDTAVVAEPVLVPFGESTVEFDLSLGPDRTGVAVTIIRRLLLAIDRPSAIPGEARLAGSVLWNDQTTVRLAGDGAAFPTEVVDFGAVHKDRNTSWYLELPESVDAPVMGSMLLLINSLDPALVAAASRSRRRSDAEEILLDEMETGVAEEIVRWAIERWDEIEHADDDTVGSAARALARRILPDPSAWRGAADSMALRSAIVSGSRALGFGRKFG